MRQRCRRGCAIAIPFLASVACWGATAAADPASDAGTRAPRLYLTPTVLARLQQRAAAQDPAWTALKAHCDGLAGGTFNTPAEPAYPNFPDVGQGYEGDGYLPEVMNLGLCYRVESGVDDASAVVHGAAGARLLEAMATPVASGGQDPSTDDGYGIRNYGVGMATGFDWLRPALSASNVTDVVTSLNSWVSWFDANGFSNNEPIGNYFEGYLLTKTATAAGTAGDNPAAAADWSDVQTRMWTQLVQPQFSASMSGGGWPEGWEYGARSVENYTQALMAAKTGEGVDWWSQVPSARDEAAYITYFAWPSRLHMDDQGTIHSGVVLTPPGVTMAYLSGMLAWNADPYAATARSATTAFLVGELPLLGCVATARGLHAAAALLLRERPESRCRPILVGHGRGLGLVRQRHVHRRARLGRTVLQPGEHRRRLGGPADPRESHGVVAASGRNGRRGPRIHRPVGE